MMGIVAGRAHLGNARGSASHLTSLKSDILGIETSQSHTLDYLRAQNG